MKKKERCSFCGMPETSASPLVKGEDARICQDCTDIARRELAAGPQLKKLGSKRPHEIKAFLDQYIIGQEEAKRTLSVAAYNHNKRIQDVGDTDLRKSNVLMLGPSGSGKTHIVETLAKMLDVPFVIGDATTLTQAGYIGEDVETLLERLLINANNDVERAEKGIIYIDEIDKIGKSKSSSTNSSSGFAVQANLLKMIEGHDVSIPSRNPLRAEEDLDVISTHNILFIAGGAFESLRKEKDKPIRTVGFQMTGEAELGEKNKTPVTSQDLVEFGMLPEFIGRLPVLVELNDLTEEDLGEILEKPKDAILKEYAQLLAMDGVHLSFSKDAVKHVAKNAIERGLGARGLRSIIEKQMLSLMYEVPEYLEREKINSINIAITKRVLTGEEEWHTQLRKGASAC